MNNDQHNNDGHGHHRFPHGFHIGATLQNVFRNINHAFTSHGTGSGGEQGNNNVDDRMEDIPPLEPISSPVARPGLNAVDTTGASSSSAVAGPIMISVDASMPPPSIIPTRQSQPEREREDDEDSMPDLRTVTDSSDESDAGATDTSQMPPLQPAEDDEDSAWTDDEDDLPPLEPLTGSRRARVEDDIDEARDRRHPSERVGGPATTANLPLQPSDPQQPPRPQGGENIFPAAGFGPLFGLGPWAGNGPDQDVPMEHTAGFTFTIPLNGPAPANQNGAGPTAGAQGPLHMDAATREELFSSFAAFFQEVQNLHALDEPREDPERAKKLIAGLEVVPLGLVKRLERVGGAPGGHADGTSAESSSTGCAICWDTLLDAESDGFTAHEGQAAESLSSGMAEGAGQIEGSPNTDAMETDPASAASRSFSEPAAASTSSDPASGSPCEGPKIIALPCAHVFHASCLLPWFTRAKQATCPTCRFNIDPENLTYTPPPRRAFNWPHAPPPAQPNNSATAESQASQEAPAGAAATDPLVAPPPLNPIPASVDAPTAVAGAAPQPAAAPPSTGQAEPRQPGPGFNPFAGMPGIHIFPFPGVHIPFRPPAAEAPGNQGMPPPPPPPPFPRTRTQSLPNMADNRPFGTTGGDFVTIGLDMFVGGPPGEGGGNGGGGGGGGEGAPAPLAREVQSLIEGIMRTTRNMFPQTMNPQGAAAPADGAAQAAPGPLPQAAGPHPAPATGSPQAAPRPPPPRPNFFRPMRPMPPRRERKSWTLPPAPGPSLRQRVEQREREEGLRCFDTSCGIGPSDEFPLLSPSSRKHVSIHPHHDHDRSISGAVCAHTFHPACLVSAERVAGWGDEGKSKTEPLIEVSCPVCRAVGCVTREEWEEGVSAL